MIASARSLRLALAVGCALTFVACGTGGGVTPPPANKFLPSTKVVKGTGTLTIKFPKHLVHITSSVAARHAARASRRVASTIVGSVRSTAAKRSPKFVDPNGTFLEVSSFGSCDDSSLGIFNFPSGVTFVPIAPNNLDGSETVTVPIVSDSQGCSTIVYVYEVGDGDQYSSPAQYPGSPPSYGDVISYGEGITSGGVTAGTAATPLTITLSIAPAMLAITEDMTTGDDGEGDFLTTGMDGAPSWQMDAINFSDSNDDYAYSYVLAADYLQSSDNCYFYPPDTAGAGGMPTINIAAQQADNGGTSRVATIQSGAVVIYADDDFDNVMAEFSSTVAPFPQDGPYTPAYDWLSPVLGLQTTTGWVYVEPYPEECDC